MLLAAALWAASTIAHFSDGGSRNADDGEGPNWLAEVPPKLEALCLRARGPHVGSLESWRAVALWDGEFDL
jgi:hypothetical protein